MSVPRTWVRLLKLPFEKEEKTSQCLLNNSWVPTTDTKNSITSQYEVHILDPFAIGMGWP